jgi:hypothetical protein|tara:strand:- start:568 stop:1149 length:582 start_codon:yes stop_codon:yes gene_type:complete
MLFLVILYDHVLIANNPYHAAPPLALAQFRKPQAGFQRRSNPALEQSNEAQRSNTAPILEPCIQHHSNCRLGQISKQERVKPGVHQFFSIADKAAQPEEPCAVHKHGTEKYSDSCSECRLKPSQLLNHPSSGSRCECEPNQVSACGAGNIDQSGRRGRRASENRKAKRAFQKVDYYNKSTANWTQKKSKAQDC